jgi:hypothetical protein
MNNCVEKGWRLREAEKKMTQQEIAEETPAFPVQRCCGGVKL